MYHAGVGWDSADCRDQPPVVMQTYPLRLLTTSARNEQLSLFGLWCAQLVMDFATSWMPFDKQKPSKRVFHLQHRWQHPFHYQRFYWTRFSTLDDSKHLFCAMVTRLHEIFSAFKQHRLCGILVHLIAAHQVMIAQVTRISTLCSILQPKKTVTTH